MIRFFLLIGLMSFLSTSAQTNLYQRNGFDYSKASIPADQILPGGPPRDGIPAIDQPQFKPARKAFYLTSEDRVLGVVLNGVAKAYPIRILNHHEIVNDDFEGQKVVITYCPLCGSGMAFEASIAEVDYTFGVSGLLYNSDVLLYDRQTESLWSQIHSEAVSGPLQGTALSFIATANTSWGAWKKAHPETVVLSMDTGYERDYTQTPYDGYDLNEKLFFPVLQQDKRFHRKEKIVGVIVDGVAKAYPLSALKKQKEPFQDVINGQTFTITYNRKGKSASITDAQGNIKEAVTLFWFAWFGFHPDTEVWTGD